MKRKRDECLKAAGLVLESTQLHQVVNAVFVILNMAIEHGRVRTQPKLVRDASSIEPLLAVKLVVADDAAHPVGKYFRAAAGERIHSRELHFFERLSGGKLGTLRQIADLDHGERFYMDFGKALLQPGDQIEKISERKIRMQAADDVELRDCFRITLRRGLPSFFERHGVRASRIFFAFVSPEAARTHAD